MYSIVPGASASRDSESSAAVMFSSSAEPFRPAKSMGSTTFTKHNGRKVVKSAPTSQYMQPKSNPESPKRSRNNHATIEELDHMLEDDALKLLNIKKELRQVQREEIEKIGQQLKALKKEHDLLRNANDKRERDIQTARDQYHALAGVAEATNSSASVHQDHVAIFNEQIAVVTEDLAAQQRTIKMQNTMIKRILQEIDDCKIETSKATLALDHAKHDLAAADNNVTIHKQELVDLEQQYNKLVSTVKQRKQQRAGKIQLLHSMSMEGEGSVAKLQRSLMDSNKRARSSMRRRNGDSMARGNTGKGQGGGGGEDEDDELMEDLTTSDLSATVKRMSPEQVREMLQRYQSQSVRMDRLQQLEAELKTSMTQQKTKKADLSDQLHQTTFKIQQLASSRQVYQEVDLKDAALAAAVKQCDEYKEKDFRLRLNIESLKQCIPRFLTKVTKVVHPKPTENQLHDAILKLEDELAKLIKVISTALMKEATPDDLALISQQQQTASASAAAAAASPNGTTTAADTLSEFGRLQRLPGFSRLQRQLFFNLMTARPDLSDQNVRIGQSPHKVKKPHTTTGMTAGMASTSPRAARINNGYRRNQSDQSLEEDSELKLSLQSAYKDGEEEEEDSMDRETVKNISKLIYERDFLKQQAEEGAMQ